VAYIYHVGNVSAGQIRARETRVPKKIIQIGNGNAIVIAIAIAIVIAKTNAKTTSPKVIGSPRSPKISGRLSGIKIARDPPDTKFLEMRLEEGLAEVTLPGVAVL
jgi:hypothetical protein